MTHQELVSRAERWLRNSQKCGVVLTECSGSGIEIPDAIGWKGSGNHSILVECKVSRADFRADAKKPHRHPMYRLAVGQRRFYLVPRGLVSPEEVPEGWGLLEVRGSTIKVVKQPVPFDRENIAAWREMAMMWSELRKVQTAQRQPDAGTPPTPPGPEAVACPS